MIQLTLIAFQSEYATDFAFRTATLYIKDIALAYGYRNEEKKRPSDHTEEMKMKLFIKLIKSNLRNHA